jgi:thymidylate synthase (FAD)
MRIVKPSFIIEDEIDGMAILKKIEKAGRTCYKSESTENSCNEFVARLIKSGHESVLEHEKITVRIICDRGVSHELVRHRLASFSQESTRFCSYDKERFEGHISVIEPFPFEDKIKRGIWKEAMYGAEKAYFELIEQGATPQEARSVLPNSLKTEIVVTANLREWRWILKERTSNKAHPQMREIMRPLLREFQRLIPVVFDDIGGSDEKTNCN